MRKVLTRARAPRLAGEAASNAVPGLEFVGDAALVVDLADMAREFATLQALSLDEPPRPDV